MTTEQQRQRAFRRDLRRRQADGTLHEWRPLRMDWGNGPVETEIAPRWFRQAVREAKRTMQATGTPARQLRPRERREGRTQRTARTGSAPTGDPDLAKPGSGLSARRALDFEALS